MFRIWCGIHNGQLRSWKRTFAKVWENGGNLFALLRSITCDVNKTIFYIDIWIFYMIDLVLFHSCNAVEWTVPTTGNGARWYQIAAVVVVKQRTVPWHPTTDIPKAAQKALIDGSKTALIYSVYWWLLLQPSRLVKNRA